MDIAYTEYDDSEPLVDRPDPSDYLDDPEPMYEGCAADPDGCIWESDEVSPGNIVWFCDNPDHQDD